MSKISKIANKGIQYDLGSSGDNIRVATFNDEHGSVVILEKKAPGLVVAYINVQLNGNRDKQPSITSLRNDFRGFEGTIYNIVVPDANSGGFDASMVVSSNDINVYSNYYTSGRVLSTITYRVR